MPIAIVAGPDAGHAFPAVALALRLRDAGYEPVVFTGTRWAELATRRGVAMRPLQGLAPRPQDNDLDAGARIHARAGHMATLLIPDLRELAPELVISDVITAGGGLGAELCGLPWMELSPHPLYAPSKGLPPIGSGLAPGTGLRGRLRDHLMRAATARSIRQGLAQRLEVRRQLGLPDIAEPPVRRLIATLPILEVPRPDWPAEAVVIGPLHLEPTDAELPLPPGDGPLVMLAPSTAVGGIEDLPSVVLEAVARPALRALGARLVISSLTPVEEDLPPWAAAGLGRQDLALAQSSAIICGGGHGMLSKALVAGVPSVIVPGGGDQWELAQRARRRGVAEVVRPVSIDAIETAALRVLRDPAYRRAAAGGCPSAEPGAKPGTAEVGSTDPVEAITSYLCG